MGFFLHFNMSQFYLKYKFKPVHVLAILEPRPPLYAIPLVSPGYCVDYDQLEGCSAQVLCSNKAH